MTDKEKQALMTAADAATMQIARLMKERDTLDERIASLRHVLATRDEVFGRTNALNLRPADTRRALWGSIIRHIDGVLTVSEPLTVRQICHAISRTYQTDHDWYSVRRSLERGAHKGTYARTDDGRWRKTALTITEIIPVE